jgi:hypothetical protein
MSKQTSLAILLACSLLLTGCIDMESVVTVNRDGSGIIEETTLLGPQLTAMLAMVTAGSAQGQTGAVSVSSNPLTTPDKAEAKAKLMGPGVTVRSMENVKAADGRQGQKIVYAFADIGRIQYTPGDISATPAAPSAAGTSSRPTTFAFSNGVLTIKGNGIGGGTGGAAPPLPRPAGSPAPAAGAKPAPSAQEIAMITSMFAGMRVAMKVRSASGIASTDASYVDGDTVTLVDIQMDKLFNNPAVLARLSAMSNNPAASPADVLESFKDIEGVRGEPKDIVTVRLK